MSKKAFRRILIQYQDIKNEDNELSKFLNDKYTGEIFDIKAFCDHPRTSDALYYFLYNKLEDSDLNEIDDKQKKIVSEVKRPKSKPKML